MVTTEREELKRLNQQFDKLGSMARAEQYVPKKDDLERQKGEVYVKKQRLNEKIKAQENEQAEKEINTLLKENRSMLVVEINNGRIQIPENLEVKLRFLPCDHEQKIHVPELLRATHYHAGKHNPEENTSLRDRWIRVLKEHEIFTTSYTCYKCHVEQENKIARHQTYSHVSIGTCKVLIRKLQ